MEMKCVGFVALLRRAPVCLPVRLPLSTRSSAIHGTPSSPEGMPTRLTYGKPFQRDDNQHAQPSSTGGRDERASSPVWTCTTPRYVCCFLSPNMSLAAAEGVSVQEDSMGVLRAGALAAMDQRPSGAHVTQIPHNLVEGCRTCVFCLHDGCSQSTRAWGSRPIRGRRIAVRDSCHMWRRSSRFMSDWLTPADSFNHLDNICRPTPAARKNFHPPRARPG